VFDVSYFSAEVGLRKPDPRFFQLILDDLGVKAGEALFVDDFKENIIGAQEMGIRTVWFKEPAAAFAELKRTLPLPG
jgi:HAD superfamily hydrolase (TIGR01509 family)